MAHSTLGIVAFVCAALVGVVAPPASAEAFEAIVRNDSAPPQTPCNCFLPGESVAAWLTAKCDGDLVGVQVRWTAVIGGAPTQTEDSISVFAAGTFPAPGATLVSGGVDPAVVALPMLAEGVVNEFRFLDPPADTKALSVPVTRGQTFVVSLKYLNQTAGTGPFGPDVGWDSSTCQANKNAVDAIPGGWNDACLLGPTGDWAIRAVIDCVTPVIPTTPPGGRPLLPLLLGGTLLLTAVGLRRRSAARSWFSSGRGWPGSDRLRSR